MELYLGRCVAWRHTFFIIDVIAVLTDSPNTRKYWSVLKTRLKREVS